ncbi:hypothetical protein ANCCEY_03512 [Ancylostoma ceylanicum]|uniref:Protein kinase domain-containing protein n=1 Tax=Ancylostoma ceylanicum TaxID=53326 RepID=A0A0D6LZW8_9BILA|nr:hypothetical protein ANCCEY_03512 [Ancylostoma ceylanicum]
MSGLFRGALNLIQGESASNSSHPLIGTQVEVGSIRLRVDSLIAEGGFAVVFAAYDSKNKWYALKRQLTKDRESMDAVLLEIRILKEIENLLFDAAGRVKLCDFGSATTQIFQPDETWNMARRTQLEEEMQRHTTPMYRAPEILDTYQNYVVGPQQDIWALGCVLFYLCYHVHPFEDSAKLRILNVAYTVPSGCEECRDILPIIESCLKADPLMRPGAKDLVERTEALAVALDIDLSKPVSNVDTGLLRRSQEVTEQASAMLGALKGQGLSLLKNLKDKSTAVVQKVQAKLSTQEVTWVTSRLCVVPVARSAQDQVDEDEWNARVQATGKPYVVYNLSGRPLHGNCPMEQIPCVLRNVRPQVPPPIENILKVCSSIVTALRNRRGSCVVLYGAEIHCVMVSVALLVYCKLIGDAHDAYDFVANKRRAAQRFAPSQIRSLDLIKNLTSSASVVLKFMFSVVFHTSVAKELMKFSRSDLDISIVEENNIPPDFRYVPVSLSHSIFPQGAIQNQSL